MFHWLIPRSRRMHQRENGLRPVSELVQMDPHFNAADLQARISNLTIQLLYGLCDGNMEPLRPYVTPSLYETLANKGRRYQEQGLTLNIIRPCVLRCEALGFRLEADEVRVLFRVQTRMIRYAANARRDIVQGSRSREIFELKTWELSRSAQSKTQAQPELDSTNCPSCGAAVNTYASAICPHCGTAVRVERYDWLVRGID